MHHFSTSLRGLERSQGNSSRIEGNKSFWPLNFVDGIGSAPGSRQQCTHKLNPRWHRTNHEGWKSCRKWRSRKFIVTLAVVTMVIYW